MKTRLILLSICSIGTLNLIAQTTQRIPLYETFTSSTCPPCKPGNIHLEALFAQPENVGKFTSLKYQMSWPGTGDPYYTLEGNSRRSVYAVNSVPRLEIDGGFDDGPTALTQEDMDNAYATPAIVELQANYQIDEATQTVTIQVSVKALQAIESPGGFFLHTAIFEKQTTENIKTNGETQFEHVMKKMVPNAGGTFIGAMDAGEVKTFNLSYTFNGDYVLPADATEPVNHTYDNTVEEFSDLGVVVWVQRSSTREVYQSAYAGLGTAEITEQNNQETNLFTVYPNPANTVARIVFSTGIEAGNANVMIMDYTGKVVFEQNVASVGSSSSVLDIATENFDNGMYLVTIDTKEGRQTQKLSIIHQ